MTTDEKIERLQRALEEPEGKYTHAQIRARIAELSGGNTAESLDATRSKLAAGDPGGPIDLNTPQAQRVAPRGSRMIDMGLGQSPPDDSFRTRITRGSERLGMPALGKAINWVNEVPAMALYKAIDTSLLNLPSGAADELSELTGTQVGPSQAMRQKFAEDFPKTNMAAEFAGNVNPLGAPAKIAGGVARAVDPVVRIAAKRATSLPMRAAVKVGQGAAVGAGAGATVEAAKSLTGGGTSGDALEAAGEGAKSGAKFGAGFSAASGAARNIARAVKNRSPDIKALDEAGLEPGPIPGRPVIRKDQPVTLGIGKDDQGRTNILSQLPALSKPPLIGKATPGTRASAGRVAADEIVPDVRARSRASNQRFGELQRDAYAAEGANPAQYQKIAADIDARLANQSLPDATRGALMAVRERLAPYLPPPPNPQLVQLQQMLRNASPASRAGIQQAIKVAQSQAPQPRPFTARDLDEIRDYTDSKVRSGEIKRGDVQFIQLADLMRNELRDASPRIADLNQQQSEVMKGFDRVRGLLGVKKSQREPGESAEGAAARRITERGEDTKAAGARTGAEGHSIDRLISQGPPQMLPGSQGPAQFDYKAKLDVPRLQLAQERMQINPSSLFSGAGGVTVGPLAAAGRLATRAPARLAYPMLRRAGDMPLGGKGVAADELTTAVRRRGKKKKDRQEAEQRNEE